MPYYISLLSRPFFFFPNEKDFWGRHWKIKHWIFCLHYDLIPSISIQQCTFFFTTQQTHRLCFQSYSDFLFTEQFMAMLAYLLRLFWLLISLWRSLFHYLQMCISKYHTTAFLVNWKMAKPVLPWWRGMNSQSELGLVV